MRLRRWTGLLSAVGDVWRDVFRPDLDNDHDDDHLLSHHDYPRSVQRPRLQQRGVPAWPDVPIGRNVLYVRRPARGLRRPPNGFGRPLRLWRMSDGPDVRSCTDPGHVLVQLHVLLTETPP